MWLFCKWMNDKWSRSFFCFWHRKCHVLVCEDLKFKERFVFVDIWGSSCKLTLIFLTFLFCSWCFSLNSYLKLLNLPLQPCDAELCGWSLREGQRDDFSLRPFWTWNNMLSVQIACTHTHTCTHLCLSQDRVTSERQINVIFFCLSFIILIELRLFIYLFIFLWLLPLEKKLHSWKTLKSL